MELFPADNLSQTIVNNSGRLATAASRKQERDRTELSQEDTNDLFFADAAMVGIVAGMPGPRFCSLLNSHFRTSFFNIPEDTIQMVIDKDGKETRKKKNKGPLPSLFGADEGIVEQVQRSNLEFFFPVYCHTKPGSNSRYLLYKLKSGAVSLLPDDKTRRYDYLWLVQTADPEHDAHLVTEILRSMPEVQVAQLLDATDMEKSRENLLL